MSIKFILPMAMATLSFSSYAIKGHPKILPESVKESSCLIMSQYANLSEKKGVCSGTLISKNKILTAKHCVLSDPEKMVRDLHNPMHTTLPTNLMSVTCNNQTVKPTSIRVHKNADLAVIEVETDTQLQEMKMANFLEMQAMKVSPGANCAGFGFGADEDGKMKTLGGVVLETSSYRFDQIAYKGALEYDFKAMGMAFGNSIYNHIPMDKAHFPYLMQNQQNSDLSIDDLKESLKAFKEKLTLAKLKQNDIFDKKLGPIYKKVFLSHFEEIYKKSFEKIIKESLDKKIANQEPLFSFIVNAKSHTDEKSGIDNGDSGGAFSCKVNGVWKLFGVNSMRSDSKLGYSPEPWEPMYYIPENRITADGIIIPVQEHIKSWINL